MKTPLETNQELSRHQFNNAIQSLIANFEILKFHLNRGDVESARKATGQLDLAIREIVESTENNRQKPAT